MLLIKKLSIWNETFLQKKIKSGKSATVNCTSVNIILFQLRLLICQFLDCGKGYTGIITSDSESDSVVDMMTKSQSGKKIT